MFLAYGYPVSPGLGPARLALVNPVRSGRKQRQRDAGALRICPARVALFIWSAKGILPVAWVANQKCDFDLLTKASHPWREVNQLRLKKHKTSHKIVYP
jgi:hypothetical protein